jgi:hypothetical protein
MELQTEGSEESVTGPKCEPVSGGGPGASTAVRASNVIRFDGGGEQVAEVRSDV